MWMKIVLSKPDAQMTENAHKIYLPLFLDIITINKHICFEKEIRQRAKGKRGIGVGGWMLEVRLIFDLLLFYAK